MLQNRPIQDMHQFLGLAVLLPGTAALMGKVFFYACGNGDKSQADINILHCLHLVASSFYLLLVWCI